MMTSHLATDHDPVPDVDDEPAEYGPPAARVVVGRLLVVLVAAGVVVCGWQAWRWWHTTQSDVAVSAGVAADRDSATTAARDGVVAFNTVDYRQVDGSLDRWAATSTGTLHDQVMSERPKVVKAVTDAKTVTTGRLIQLALTTFDRASGTAAVIAVVEIRSVPDGQPASTTRSRFAGQLQRTDGGWKLSSVQLLQAAP